MKNVLVIFAIIFGSVVHAQTMQSDKPRRLFPGVPFVDSIDINFSKSWIKTVDFTIEEQEFMKVIRTFFASVGDTTCLFPKGGRAVKKDGVLFLLPPHPEKKKCYYFLNPTDVNSPLTGHYLRKDSIVFKGQVVRYKDEPVAGWEIDQHPIRAIRKWFGPKKQHREHK